MFESVRVGSGSGAVEAVIVGQFKGEPLDERSAAVDPSGYAAWLSGQPEASGEAGSCVTAFPDTDNYDAPARVVIVGLGDRETFELGRLRGAAGAAGRALAKAGASKAASAVHEALLTLGDPPAMSEAGRALGEGLGIVSFNQDGFKGSASGDKKKDRVKLTVSCAHKGFAGGIGEGLGIAEGTNFARMLSNTPPNIATPIWMAAQAKKLARETGMTCTVMKGDTLVKERMEGLINVGKASENEPCMIRLEYTPSGGSRSGRAGKRRGAGGAKPVVLVGKTITYDCGGLSIKVGGSMRGMKRDKDGGCGVLGAMKIIAGVIKPKVPVVALLACAENSISDEAYRPDDILTFRNGVTVEVTNTDAEGRLVMADALCWACDEENPRAVIDFATLTGGVVVALGRHYAGLWTEDDTLLTVLRAAGEETGERVWHLPMGAEYRGMMKAQIADVWNSAPVREAHGIQGAAFLSYFVADGVPWAHVDIAGVHDLDKQTGPFEAGPSGFGARLAAAAVSRV